MNIYKISLYSENRNILSGSMLNLTYHTNIDWTLAYASHCSKSFIHTIYFNPHTNFVISSNLYMKKLGFREFK